MGAKYSYKWCGHFADQASIILGKKSLDFFEGVQTLAGHYHGIWCDSTDSNSIGNLLFTLCVYINQDVVFLQNQDIVSLQNQVWGLELVSIYIYIYMCMS